MQRERRKNISPPDISTFPTILTVTFTNAFYLARKFDAIVLNVDRIVRIRWFTQILLASRF